MINYNSSILVEDGCIILLFLVLVWD